MTIDLLWLIIAIFAIYRLAILVAEDNGPGFVFKHLRSFIDNQALKQQNKGSEYGPWISANEGIHCSFCVGIWMAILCTILLIYSTMLGDIFLLIFGLAGAQSFLQRLAN